MNIEYERLLAKQIDQSFYKRGGKGREPAEVLGAMCGYAAKVKRLLANCPKERLNKLRGSYSGFHEYISLLQTLEKRCQGKITSLQNSIQQMPNSEMKYWFSQLHGAVVIESQNPTTKLLEFLSSACDLTVSTTKHLKMNKDRNSKLPKLQDTLKKFIALSKTSNLSEKTKRVALNVIGCIASLVCGAVGSVIGLFAGFFSRKNVIKGAAVGIMTGAYVGASFGYRIPKKIKNQRKRRMKIYVDAINRSYGNYDNNRGEGMRAVKKEFRNHFNNQAEFDRFLTNEQEYEVCASKAKFISSHLAGHLGQHAFIKFKAGRESILIDKARGNDARISQSEHRKATGEKLLEMLVLHRKIKTSAINWKYYKVGERDCHTYADIILVGTGQKAHRLK